APSSSVRTSWCSDGRPRTPPTRLDTAAAPAASGGPGSARLRRGAVEMRDRYRVEVDVLEAADVDRRRALALRIRAFGERMNAADEAEAMLDRLAVEKIRAQVLDRRQEPQPLARHEPQERALAAAHRAIARHGAVDLTVDLERDGAAVTTSLVFHRPSEPAAKIL